MCQVGGSMYSSLCLAPIAPSAFAEAAAPAAVLEVLLCTRFSSSSISQICFRRPWQGMAVPVLRPGCPSCSVLSIMNPYVTSVPSFAHVLLLVTGP
jgi:hypothetical protein